MKYNSESEFLEKNNLVEKKRQDEEFGCGFCWDKKRKKEKELFFLDTANNMRPCTYCPSCGRKLEV